MKEPEPRQPPEGTAARQAKAMVYAEQVKADLDRELDQRRSLLRVMRPVDPGQPKSLLEQMAGILERWDLKKGVRR